MDRIVNILKQNQLSVTDGRRKILSLFLNSSGALAHADIEKSTDEHFDRVTVYRTLQSFVDKGIIHTIPTADNSIKYALCKDECGQGHHHDHHIHLICDECGNTLCLDDVVTPTVNLPGGFSAKQVDVVVKGTCDQCNAKHPSK